MPRRRVARVSEIARATECDGYASAVLDLSLADGTIRRPVTTSGAGACASIRRSFADLQKLSPGPDGSLLLLVFATIGTEVSVWVTLNGTIPRTCSVCVTVDPAVPLPSTEGPEGFWSLLTGILGGPFGGPLLWPLFATLRWLAPLRRRLPVEWLPDSDPCLFTLADRDEIAPIWKVVEWLLNLLSWRAPESAAAWSACL